MQTSFTADQRADPQIAHAEQILRKCVHCGFCLATCPTYVELGNELDSPRGRIYLIKDMLENERAPTAKVVTHIDRCLSCLACMTTCPSGVNYMHLVDHARAHIERTWRRPAADRWMRALLAFVLPYPRRFRFALLGAFFARPLAPLFEVLGGPMRRMGAMLRLAPTRFAAPSTATPGRRFAPQGERTGRVALLTGCAQPVLAPAINEAAIRLFNRLGVEVVLVKGEGCCGALVHHMGREKAARSFARANIDAWTREIAAGGLDAVVVTTSGCGTTVKDYGHMLAGDVGYAAKAAQIAALARDVTEVLAARELPPPVRRPGLTVAYHSACSMQHGQGIVFEPKLLLERAGFVVRDVPEGHLCCGSAGTYNILQPEIAARLRDRKARNIEATGADLVATGNIGCITQIAGATAMSVVHTIELLDWAHGGPTPEAVDRLTATARGTGEARQPR